MTLKTNYDSEENDVLTEFYVPVLSIANRYDRLAGFFSSSALAIAAKGIASFIDNNGKMRLICGVGMQKSDVDAIIEGKESPEKIISEILIGNINELYNSIVTNHVRALGWLVAKQMLDIKVAIVLNASGQPMTHQDSIKTGIFHQKVGILEDSEGNKISFSGSINETAYAWNQNM